MDRLRVGINLVFLTPGAQGGMESYVRELVPRLALRDDLDLTVFVSCEAAGGDWGAREVRIPVHPADRKQWVYGEQVLLPPKARASQCQVLHSMASTAPLWGGFRRVTTIHDLMYKMVPDAHTGLLGRGMAVLVGGAARRSHRVIAVSESTAHDIHTQLGVPRSEIDVVYHGVSAPRVAPTPERDLRSRLGLGQRSVVLCVAPKRPAKNLAALIKAHALLREPRPVLVLPGYTTPYEIELRNIAASAGTSDDIRFLEWVSAADLEGLYQLSALLAFPSLYEGFGMPPLEAMARGVPVVTSDRGSLGEVVGNAAVIVDPERVSSIADGIQKLLFDPVECRRMAQAGRSRANDFTWSAAADKTVASYRAAFAGTGSAGIMRSRSGDQRAVPSAVMPLPITR